MISEYDEAHKVVMETKILEELHKVEEDLEEVKNQSTPKIAKTYLMLTMHLSKATAAMAPVLLMLL